MDPSVVMDWTQVSVWIIVLAAIVCAIVRFLRMPTDQQAKVIRECLLSWVVQAETQLGSGTGKVKLSEVYSRFAETFPMLRDAVPFDTFSCWVDEALADMRKMLKTNASLREAMGIEEGKEV